MFTLMFSSMLIKQLLILTFFCDKANILLYATPVKFLSQNSSPYTRL